MVYSKHTPIDLSQPFQVSRALKAIHVHHSAGNELDTPAAVERYAMAREGKHFGQDPYNIHIWRGPDSPIPGENTWMISWGRNPETMPASAEGDNKGALAICVHGNWAQSPLPLWGLESLVKVIRWVWQGAGELPVYGHRELPGEETLCPGFDMNLVRRMLSNV